MFDNRCCLTGIPLYGEVVFVLLLDEEGAWAPCSLPMRGRRNPYDGGFEATRVDTNGALICAGVRSLLEREVLRVDYPALGVDPVAITPSTEFMASFSVALFRDCVEKDHVRCDGRRLTYALIDGFVFDSLGRERPAEGPCRALQALRPLEPAVSFYGGSPELAEISLAAGKFRGVLKLIDRLALRLNPIQLGEQFDEADARQIWQDTLAKYKLIPSIAEGLLAYGEAEGFYAGTEPQ
jgi:hypothetical protein